MALVVKDRIRETSTTTGTGVFTLSGAVSGFRSFADIGNANTTYYTIVGETEWEVGVGTYTSSGTTLDRTTVLSNSLGTTALINFSAGTKDVFVSLPAPKAIYKDNLPSILIVTVRAGTTSNVSLSNGFLPVTNRAGSTISVAVS
jgi:hypothetical protein